MSYKSEFEYMEWVEIDMMGWHLKDNAPNYVEKAFNEYMKDDSIIIGD